MTANQAAAETIEFIYEHVRDAPERQLRDAADLDGKMVQLFAADTVLMGLLGLGTGRGVAWAVPAALALVVYLVIALYVAFRHLQPVTMYGSRYADNLWDLYRDQSPNVIRRLIIEKVAKDYGRNRSVLDGKAATLTVAFALTTLETALVAFALAMRLL